MSRVCERIPGISLATKYSFFPSPTRTGGPLRAATIFCGSRVESSANAYAPTADATNCDYNGDGKINFTAGNPEDLCSIACTANPECSEYSSFAAQQQFNLVVVSGTTTTFALVDGAASQTFNPVELRGMPVSSFTGNLRYFSGGTQFTITARCSDDIVMDTTKPPLPSDKACVTARTIADKPSF